ncbi:N-acetylmuramoyl-L-alanine amidase [Bosea sp. (in: a-proteobacteria)]|uniref:N-acetylmuramoyl-L-alanine amidase n=1 Tax=Bosea sp. (in: a-proteobacteria) TaxID=1871050 RepID=UPI002FC6B17C
MFRVRNHKLALGASNVEFIKSPNIGGALAPKFLVIHYTASGPGADIARYFTRPEAKVSAHLVIRRDGTVIQCVPFDVVGWHAGRSRWTDKTGKYHAGLNQTSIGIEVENWGPLRRTGSGWVSWKEAAVDPSKVIEARHKFGDPDCGWETYTEAQIEATLQAARAICGEYGIDEIVGHDDISLIGKIDPGPAWNMGSFKAKVLGRNTNGPPTWTVRSPTGLNIRSGPGMEHPALRPQPLPDGTVAILHEASGQWRFVSVLNAAGQPDFSGWVHGGFLFES